jgi:hypothetical protein
MTPIDVIHGGKRLQWAISQILSADPNRVFAMDDPADLPHVDEHSIAIEATPDATWDGLLRVVEGSFASGASARGARLLGCADTVASGPRPLAAGSVLPGFHVATADRPKELALAGGHRFSDYALIFRLDEQGDSGTMLRAETRATFPGLKGSAYRAIVIGTRMHVLVTRRVLDAARRRAERH